jgi:hypothetical protein
MGPVTVTDARGSLTATWTATVSSTDYTTGGGTPAKPSTSVLARALLIGAAGVVVLALGVYFLRRVLKPARPAGF